MTTRLRRPAAPPPPRGRSGRLGLFPPLGMRTTSVDAGERGIDVDGAAERPLESGEGAARIDAAPGKAPARRELAVAERKPDELVLRRAAAAAGAAPDR